MERVRNGRWRSLGRNGVCHELTINVGSLVLDMYDPTSKQLVWTGTATKTIEPSSNQEKREESGQGYAEVIEVLSPQTEIEKLEFFCKMRQWASACSIPHRIPK